VRRAALVLAAALLALPAAARANSTLVVDDDHAQCPAAGFTSLQAAIDASQSHDTIRICPGTYSVGTAGAPRPSNGLLIDKSLTIVGAGASKVTIQPIGDLGDTALTPAKLRDATGNIITIKNTSPGSTSVQDVSVALSGVTVKDAGFAVDAGIAVSNAYAQITASAIGPFTGAGQSWGVVAVNTESVSPPGAFVRVLTLNGDSITGYGGGGVLIDGATSAAPTTASGISTTGIITGNVIQGTADTTRASQVGIQVNQGGRATITGDAISGNLASTATGGIGVLLTNSDNAKTSPTANTYFTSLGRDNITGNGYGIYNAADNTVTTLSATPVQANLPGGSWYGTGGPVSGPSTATQDGVSDAVVTGTAAAAPFTIAPVPAAVPDAAPTASWGTPATGDSLVAGASNDLLALAGDDFGVTSVDVTANGEDLGTLATPPYATTWTPRAALAGTSVTLTATVTDEAGQTTVASEIVPVVAASSSGGGSGGTPPASGGGTPTPTPVGTTPVAKLSLAGYALSPSKPKAKTAANAVLSFSLNRSAPVRVTLVRLDKGRKVGTRCVKATAKNRSRKSCARTVKIGAKSLTGVAGKNRLTLAALAAGKKLAAGSYRITLTPTGGAAVTMHVTIRTR
jgi:hypothetical protein